MEASTFEPTQERQEEVEELRRRVDTLEKDYKKDMEEVKELLRQILSHLTQTAEQRARRPTPEPIPSDHGNDGDDQGDEDDDDVSPPPPFDYYPSPEPHTSPALTHLSPLQTSDTHTSPLHTSDTHTSPLHTPPTHSPKEPTEAESPFVSNKTASPPQSPQFHQARAPTPTLHTTPPSSPIYNPTQPSPKAYSKQRKGGEVPEDSGFDLNTLAARAVHAGRVMRASPHNPQKNTGWAKIFSPFNVRAKMARPA